MQEKCPLMLTCPLGVVILDDELTWRHVRQRVLLQGKVPGDGCGRFRGRLPLTSRSLRFLARLKALSGGLLKILLVELSSRRILRFLEMIFPATRLQGYNWYIIISVVVWSITLQNFSPWIGRCSSPSPSNEVIRIPACCKKGLPFCCLDVGVSVITAHLTQSEKLTTRYGWLATVRMGWTEGWRLVALYDSVNKWLDLLLRVLCGITRNLLVELMVCQLSFGFSYVEICAPHNTSLSFISMSDHHVRSILQLV